MRTDPRNAGETEQPSQGPGPQVSVVVASIEARATCVASLGRFVEEAGPRGEVILADGSRDDTAGVIERTFPTVRVVRLGPGPLAPELWSEGLRAARAPLVAFSTAQMVASAGWLSALRRALETTGAAVAGGPIEPAPALAAADRALYLQRYVNYLPPLPAEADAIEPPGDNALYRRASLDRLEPLWRAGFWEVEVHRRLRERGERLTMAADAVLEFRGGARLGPALRQRRDHARHYGAARAQRMSSGERIARSAAAPVVPAVLIRRIAAVLAARGKPLGPWVPAFAPLSLLLAAWSVGEAEGTWRGRPAHESKKVA
jgi:hypothetical protein